MEPSDNHHRLAMLLRVLGGLLVFFIGFIFLWVGLGSATGLISEPSAVKAIIIILSLYISVRLLLCSWRLIFNRPAQRDDLLYPVEWWAVGIIFLSLAVFSFFTEGVNATQIVSRLLIVGAAIYLAAVRSKHLASANSPIRKRQSDDSRSSTQDRQSETVISRIQETFFLLRRKYPIVETWFGNQGKFTVSGIDDTFYLNVSPDHCILSTDSWHEHFQEQSGILYGMDGTYSFEEFLDGLFKGTIQILVKYRGTTRVGQQVLILQGEEVVAAHRTIVLLPLFWRKKSVRKLVYRPINKKEGGGMPAVSISDG
jgi:hypothetical protein